MEQNRTGTAATVDDSPFEGQMLFISNVVSNEYRDTLYDCFGMSLQIYALAKTDWITFPDDEEIFISFLFNMLEHSFEIRKNSEDMIIYGDNADFINYAKSAGALL